MATESEHAAHKHLTVIRGDEPKIPNSTASFGTDHMKESGLPLFEIRHIPGKGKGLVARFDIAEGTRLLDEKPLSTVPNMAPELHETVLASKLKSLTKDEQRRYLSLHNNFPGKYPFSGIAKTNALPCGSGSVVGGIYPTICLINHSCLPNSHNNWNDDKERETIHAIRPIRSGEEITISYDNGGPSTVRWTQLKQAFGFDCKCDVCSLPPPELHRSNGRREQIQQLGEAIGDPFRIMRNPITALSDCYSSFKLIKEEYRGHAGALFPRLYYDAFQICVAHGDRSRATVFAEHAYKARVVCEGEDSPATEKMRRLMQDPTSHINFGGYSMRWKTKRESVPEGTDALEFERWLWKLK